MMEKDDTRQMLLHQLLTLSAPVEQVLPQLLTLRWDEAGQPEQLTRANLRAALQRNGAGMLSAAELERWANALEGRDDLDFETGHEAAIDKVLFELANPLLTQALDRQRTDVLLSLLSEQAEH